MRGSGKATKMASGHFVWQKVAKNQGHMGGFNLFCPKIALSWANSGVSIGSLGVYIHVDSYF